LCGGCGGCDGCGGGSFGGVVVVGVYKVIFVSNPT